MIEPLQRLCVFDVDESTCDIAVVMLEWWLYEILLTFRASVTD